MLDKKMFLTHLASITNKADGKNINLQEGELVSVTNPKTGRTVQLPPDLAAQAEKEFARQAQETQEKEEDNKRWAKDPDGNPIIGALSPEETEWRNITSRSNLDFDDYDRLYELSKVLGPDKRRDFGFMPRTAMWADLRARGYSPIPPRVDPTTAPQTGANVSSTGTYSSQEKAAIEAAARARRARQNAQAGLDSGEKLTSSGDVVPTDPNAQFDRRVALRRISSPPGPIQPTDLEGNELPPSPRPSVTQRGNVPGIKAGMGGPIQPTDLDGNELPTTVTPSQKTGKYRMWDRNKKAIVSSDAPGVDRVWTDSKGDYRVEGGTNRRIYIK